MSVLLITLEVQGRRVELDEFEVGDVGPGAQCQGHAVPDGHRRVGGRLEDLSHAAGGEHDRAGLDAAHAVFDAFAEDVEAHSGRAAV
ncbi:hypothetical protein GCM10029992_09910 [Glycomyces albus]